MQYNEQINFLNFLRTSIMKKNKCQCIVLKLYNTRIMILKGVHAKKNPTQLFNFKETLK